MLRTEVCKGYRIILHRNIAMPAMLNQSDNLALNCYIAMQQYGSVPRP
jgi:hypothetical protein